MQTPLYDGQQVLPVACPITQAQGSQCADSVDANRASATSAWQAQLSDLPCDVTYECAPLTAAAAAAAVATSAAPLAMRGLGMLRKRSAMSVKHAAPARRQENAPEHILLPLPLSEPVHQQQHDRNKDEMQGQGQLERLWEQQPTQPEEGGLSGQHEREGRGCLQAAPQNLASNSLHDSAIIACAASVDTHSVPLLAAGV